MGYVEVPWVHEVDTAAAITQDQHLHDWSGVDGVYLVGDLKVGEDTLFFNKYRF